jgi:hypothetical protein
LRIKIDTWENICYSVSVVNKTIEKTMYTHTNYKTKKALKADVAAGKRVTTFQPGGLFPAQTDGVAAIEGPHYPEPHRWYASVVLKDGVVVSVK